MMKHLTMKYFLQRLSVAVAVCLMCMSSQAVAEAPASKLLTSNVYHVPLADGSADQKITITATVAAGWASQLELRVRGAAGSAWQSFRFQRSSDTQYVAVIPAEVVQAPSLDYFIVGTSEQGTWAHFASEAEPHRVYIYKDSDVAVREQELDRFHGRRAQIQLSAELIDFGTRDIVDRNTGQTHAVKDSYYRIDTSVTYRLMRYPLRALRFGYTRLIGTTPTTARGDGACNGESAANPCDLSAGFRAGGWVETQWRLGTLLNLDTRALIQATPTGFGLGGRGELRFGDDIGSHFALGVESITEVGTTSYVRLGWGTVPHFPMAATIELSDYPSKHRDTGVRLLYDVAYDVGNGLRVGVRVGYQARDEGIGGLATGANVSFDF